MGVSRLDAAVLCGTITPNTANLNAPTIAPALGTGANGNGTAFIGPVNGLVTVFFGGTLNSGVYQLQAWDGFQWISVGSSVTSVGAVVTQITALGLRAVVSGATAGASITVTAVFVEY